MLRHLDLFSGIGGWTLGFHATNQIQTVGFCEIEKFPQAVLKHHYPNIPIFEDIRKLDYERMESAGLFRDGSIDILTCSYPCQPFSVAGKKRGEKDKRHLWPEVLRLIKDDRIRPYYVLGENVGGHIRIGLDSVSEDMERCGYRWRCFSIEAACIGANHRRQRVWWIAEDVANPQRNGFNRAKKSRSSKETIRQKQKGEKNTFNSKGANSLSRTEKVVADSSSIRPPSKPKRDSRSMGKESQEEKGARNKSTICSKTFSTDVANTIGERLQGWTKARGTKESRKESKQLFTRRSNDVAHTDSRIGEALNERRILGEQNQEGPSKGYTDGGMQTRGNWESEPNVGRVAHGVPNRVHRLKALGNAIVPQMAYYIGLALLENEKRFFNH